MILNTNILVAQSGEIFLLLFFLFLKKRLLLQRPYSFQVWNPFKVQRPVLKHFFYIICLHYPFIYINTISLVKIYFPLLICLYCICELVIA